MIGRTLLVLSGALIGGSALAQAPAPPAAPRPPPPARARGPELAIAVEMAQAAVAECKAGGFRTAVLVTDSAGEPVVLLSGDGVDARMPTFAAGKIATVMKYKVASSATAAKAATDAALAAEIKADPKIGTARAGALPILVGGEMIGAIAVAGAPSSARDEACAVTALAKAQSRLN